MRVCGWGGGGGEGGYFSVSIQMRLSSIPCSYFPYIVNKGCHIVLNSLNKAKKAV